MKQDMAAVGEVEERAEHEAGATSGAVLYAAPPGPQSAQSLLRAEALARAKGERLIVLRVIPRVGSGDPLFPQVTPVRAARLLRLEAAVGRLTARWCRRLLVAPQRPGDVRVRRGALKEALRAVCAEEQVSLIVLPRHPGLDGAHVEALAMETGKPVLVADRQGPSDLVIAGSDLEDRGYPVLRFARDFCARLNAPSLFLHNVSPFWGVAQPAGTAGPGPASEAVTDRERWLEAAARRIDRGAGTELQRALDAATALVETARERGADVLVVGARPAPWGRRVLRGSVAARVVDRAEASVLVVPLAAPPAWLPRAWS